jgi:hypothetical protein
MNMLLNSCFLTARIFAAAAAAACIGIAAQALCTIAAN